MVNAIIQHSLKHKPTQLQNHTVNAKGCTLAKFVKHLLYKYMLINIYQKNLIIYNINIFFMNLIKKVCKNLQLSYVFNKLKRSKNKKTVKFSTH